MFYCIAKESIKERAKRSGAYAYLQKLNIDSLKGSMKGRVTEERIKLSSKQGTFPSPPPSFRPTQTKTHVAMAMNFLTANNCFEPSSEGYEMMKCMEKSIITCLKQKTPLSEDMLYLTWKWVCKTKKGGSSNSELWETIKETLLNVLDLPINKRDWVWFQMFVMTNVV